MRCGCGAVAEQCGWPWWTERPRRGHASNASVTAEVTARMVRTSKSFVITSATRSDDGEARAGSPDAGCLAAASASRVFEALIAVSAWSESGPKPFEVTDPAPVAALDAAERTNRVDPDARAADRGRYAGSGNVATDSSYFASQTSSLSTVHVTGSTSRSASRRASATSPPRASVTWGT